MLSLSSNDEPSSSVDRSYPYDPRTAKEPPKGLPSAGILTMMGYLSTFPRERPRAARALEMFACKSFSPPDSRIQFPEYHEDPATSGICMNCHQSLDPASMFFKRWDFNPGQSYYVPFPFIPGIGSWQINQQNAGGPYSRWATSWYPDTVLTPVTQAEIDENPGARLLDALPAGETYLGATSDGTMGPLGLGKLLVASGEFDRCVAQRMYALFVGHPLDPGRESLYIRKLAKTFVDGGRKLRPFVKYLLALDEFRRGL